MIQIFIKLLDNAYKQGLNSGQLNLAAFFLEETSPTESIYQSIKDGTIIITVIRPEYSCPYWCRDSRRTQFLLGDFLLDESRNGGFLLNAMTAHHYAFYCCVKELGDKWFIRLHAGPDGQPR